MDTEVTPTRCRVVGKPVFQMRSGVLRRWKDVNAPVQNLLFRFKLRVTNVDNIPFPGCTISDIQVTDTSHSGGVRTAFAGKFNIPTLNPRQSYEVVVDEAATLTHEGSCWINYVVEPIDGFQALVCVMKPAQHPHVSKMPPAPHDTLHKRYGSGTVSVARITVQ